MKKKTPVWIILFLVICFIVIYYSTLYPGQEYQESKPEYQSLTEDFVKQYLKQEFWPSDFNLDLKISSINEKAYHTLFWRRTEGNFQVNMEYNSDNKTLSHISIYISAITGNRSSDVFLNNLQNVGLNCYETNVGTKSCTESWNEGENRIDHLVSISVDDHVTSIRLCDMYKESEVFNLKCGIV